MTIKNSEKAIQLDSNIIWRDVGFYIISTVLVISFAVYGQLSVLSACALLAVYVIMVIVVYIQEKSKPQV